MARILKYSLSVFRFLVQELKNADPNGIEAMSCQVVDRKSRSKRSDKRMMNPFRF